MSSSRRKSLGYVSLLVVGPCVPTRCMVGCLIFLLLRLASTCIIYVHIQLRKPQAHQFIKSTGVPRGGPFLPVLQDLTNLGVDVAEDDEALEAFPAADAGPVSGLAFDLRS